PPRTYSSSLFHRYGAHRALHSFPTRRSSDLSGTRAAKPGTVKARVQPRARKRGFMACCSCRVEMNRHPATVRMTRIGLPGGTERDRKSTRLNSSHVKISYAVFCWKKKIQERY